MAFLRRCIEVEQEDQDRNSIAQLILHESTSFLRRIIGPVGGPGETTLSYVCPRCHRYPFDHYIWWVSTKHGKKQSNLWCAACGGQYDWRDPNKVLVTQDSTDRSEAKVFRVHAPSNGLRENLMCALKLLAKQQLRGDSIVRVLVEVSRKKRFKILDELRRVHHGGHSIGGESRRLGKRTQWCAQ